MNLHMCSRPVGIVKMQNKEIWKFLSSTCNCISSFLEMLLFQTVNTKFQEIFFQVQVRISTLLVFESLLFPVKKKRKRKTDYLKNEYFDLTSSFLSQHSNSGDRRKRTGYVMSYLRCLHMCVTKFVKNLHHFLF